MVSILWVAASFIPNSWKTCTINVIFKKSDPALAKKYRPISLLESLGKVVTKILVHRIRPRYHAMLSRLYHFRPKVAVNSAFARIQVARMEYGVSIKSKMPQGLNSEGFWVFLGFIPPRESENRKTQTALHMTEAELEFERTNL